MLADVQNLLSPSKDQDESNLAPIMDYNADELDYKFVASCTDLKKLKLNLNVLRSGKEGIYTDLEIAHEVRIAALDPSFIIPRQGLISESESKLVQEELLDFINTMNKNETIYKNATPQPKKTQKKRNQPQTPTQTQTIIPAPSQPQPTPNKSKALKSYRDWDLFKVDQELEKLDSQIDLPPPKITNNKNQQKHHQPHSKPPTPTSLHLSQNESQKASDSLRSNDLTESLTFYTTAIQIQPQPHFYTNRALVNLKLKNFAEALSDCDKALSMDLFHPLLPAISKGVRFKALVRRGKALFGQGFYREAVGAYEGVLEEGGLGKGDEVLVRGLLGEARKRFEEVGVKDLGGKRKMNKLKIEEVDSTVLEMGVDSTSLVDKEVEGGMVELLMPGASKTKGDGARKGPLIVEIEEKNVETKRPQIVEIEEKKVETKRPLIVEIKEEITKKNPSEKYTGLIESMDELLEDDVSNPINSISETIEEDEDFLLDMHDRSVISSTSEQLGLLLAELKDSEKEHSIEAEDLVNLILNRDKQETVTKVVKKKKLVTFNLEKNTIKKYYENWGAVEEKKNSFCVVEETGDSDSDEEIETYTLN